MVISALVPACNELGPYPADIDAALTYCVSQINQHRASVNLPALERSGALEAFAAESASVDGTAGDPHTHFTNTNGGGIASAETELLRWKNGSLHTVIQQGLAGMWQEGPAGDHYKILAGAYTLAGCGVYIGATGITVAQDFR